MRHTFRFLLRFILIYFVGIGQANQLQENAESIINLGTDSTIKVGLEAFDCSKPLTVMFKPIYHTSAFSGKAIIFHFSFSKATLIIEIQPLFKIKAG